MSLQWSFSLWSVCTLQTSHIKPSQPCLGVSVDFLPTSLKSWTMIRPPFLWSGHLSPGVCPSPLLSGCPGLRSQTDKPRSSIVLSSSLTFTQSEPTSALCVTEMSPHGDVSSLTSQNTLLFKMLKPDMKAFCSHSIPSFRRWQVVYYICPLKVPRVLKLWGKQCPRAC